MNNSILFCERHMFVSMSRLFVLIYICILDQEVCGRAVLQMYVQPAYLAPADREGQPATSANDKQSFWSHVIITFPATNQISWLSSYLELSTNC